MTTVACLMVVGLAGPGPASGHDPSAFGGLFRSRDHGATWLPANPGRVVSGALALAVSPTDPGHLLLGTDSGLLRSRNGGLDWAVEAPSVIVGMVVAVAFDAGGRQALVATGQALYRGDDGGTWRRAPLPSGAAPVRALARGSGGEVFLVGWTGLYRSGDWAGSWEALEPAGSGLEPGTPVSALAIEPGTPAAVTAVTAGRVFRSDDGGRRWQELEAGPPGSPVQALAVEPDPPARLWAVAGRQLYRRAGPGGPWQPVGAPLADGDVTVRGLAVGPGGQAITVTSDRGLYHSADGGQRWTPGGEPLPAHLEAGPLVRDPGDPATLYAGFALLPYVELWRLAAGGGPRLDRVGPASLAGGVALLALLGLLAGLALRALARHGRGARA